MATVGSHPQEPSSSRPQGCACSAGVERKRNLVVCIDGTSNQFGDYNTNVVKLFTRIDPEKQCAYYSSGIGTDPKSSGILDRMGGGIFNKINMAFAWNAGETVKETYGWLAKTYQEGDQLYFFGFSRGAYQVRVLASMIHEVGLIKTHQEKNIRRAYDHHEAIRSGDPEARHLARKFKESFSWRGMKVHFVGVWDTVSSIGLVKGNNFLSASSSAEHACHFRHALALDECRVKFMPDYFLEVNSQMDDEMSKYIVGSAGVEGVTSPASEWQESTMNDVGTNLSGGMKNKTADVKEVWFPGCHSDVGGLDRSGKLYHAGNVSLLWMRREAAACGLVLQAADVVWVPDDLDFGTSDSMTRIWRFVEYTLVKQQVSFSGVGDDAPRFHRLQPRRIIPGQKVHASILYANAYKPLASFGKGFVVHSGFNTELDSQSWETELFDDTAAEDLVAHLDGQNGNGVALIYLDKLMFMLRFEEGKQCVRKVTNWQERLSKLIDDHECAPLVRLVTLVAYYEASCDPDAHPKSTALPHVELSWQKTFDDAEKTFNDVLAAPKHRESPRVLALLRPLTRHKILWERILTKDVWETLMKFLDASIDETRENFDQAMDALTCLLEYEDTQDIIIKKLGANLPSSNVTRLSRILEVKKPHLLTAALRMMMTLARIPQARSMCSIVKPRLRELAEQDKQLVGLLSVEILIALHGPNEQEQLNIRSANVRANLARVLAGMSPDGHSSADGEGHGVDPRQLFGVGAAKLTDEHRKFIKELKSAVQKGNTQERTAATLTILKLCETEIIRTFLCEIDLLRVSINQLRRKDSALLAAYALATCLKHSDLKGSIKDNRFFPDNIVHMLRFDYFDDAIGGVQGFQIFRDFMQHADLREKIKQYDITEVLKTKLAKGDPRETRTSLICLDIFRYFDKDSPWTKDLVERSLDHLKKPDWKDQKTGVIILSALAQTKYGVVAIGSRINVIVEMLLSEGPDHSTSAPSRPPTWMMGPACALRILAQNEYLRKTVRSTPQYDHLECLYLTEKLIDKMDTPVWRVKSLNRDEVVAMIDKMMKAIDAKQAEEGLMSIGDMLPHNIQHWDRLVGLLSVPSVTFLTNAVAAPVGVSTWTIGFFKNVVAHCQDSQVFQKLRRIRIPSRAARPEHEAESDSGGATGEHGSEGKEGTSGPHNGERSHSIKTVVAQVGGDATPRQAYE